MATTIEHLSSQVTALHREVRDLRAVVDTLVVTLTEGGLAGGNVITDERGTFVPGTGWTGTRAEVEPAGEGETVDQDRGVELARAAREALRGDQ